mmetsp:Transcript_50926/g.102358  ORF Transcript_50926/g.102358 Transcript_50926/m.102358 type:complete len:270 (+) Transcript_50926:81-890(+)
MPPVWPVLLSVPSNSPQARSQISELPLPSAPASAADAGAPAAPRARRRPVAGRPSRPQPPCASGARPLPAPSACRAPSVERSSVDGIAMSKGRQALSSRHPPDRRCVVIGGGDDQGSRPVKHGIQHPPAVLCCEQSRTCRCLPHPSRTVCRTRDHTGSCGIEGSCVDSIFMPKCSHLSASGKIPNSCCLLVPSRDNLSSKLIKPCAEYQLTVLRSENLCTTLDIPHDGRFIKRCRDDPTARCIKHGTHTSVTMLCCKELGTSRHIPNRS